MTRTFGSVLVSFLSIAALLALRPLQAGASGGERAPRPAGPVSAADTSRAPDVTLRGLIGEMADLMRLFRAPRVPYVARLASSRDPASDYGNWFANDDRGRLLRSDSVDGRLEHVMMESRRPGVILRLWSANPRGTIRIYIDGAAAPAIEAPMAGLLSGSVPPFIAPFADQEGGYSLFFPISFARSCRVTTDEPSDLFYCLAYREYPEGTVVEPYDPARLAALDRELREARARLQHPSRIVGTSGSMTHRVMQVAASSLGDGRCVVPAPLGGGVIRELRIAPLPGSCPVEGVRLAITADTVSSVEGPLRAMFGASPGAVPFTTLPVELLADGTMISRWPMPFRDSLALTLSSTGGDFGATISMVIDRAPFDPAVDWYFHASWHSESSVPVRPLRDWPVIDLDGQGVYVGTLLTVANPINFWWGEGDEKLSIDGRERRDYWGTGTEDLFGGAWGIARTFSRPYHAFVETGQRGQGFGAWCGFWTMSRWYLLDPIYFSRRLQHDLEIYHTYGGATLSYGAASVWYARAGAREMEPVTSRDEVTMPSLPNVDSIAGAVEGETMRLLYFAGTYVDIWPHAPERGAGWSRGQCLWWKCAPGIAASRIQVGFTAPRDGAYRVIGYFASGPNFGRFDVEINDMAGTKGLDFAGPVVERTGPIELGSFQLDSGQNVLTFRVPSYATGWDGLLLGLDAILLEPVGAGVATPSADDASIVAWLDREHLRVRLSDAGEIAIEAMDLAGRRVAAVEPVRYEAGAHALDVGGLALPVGSYILRVTAGDRVMSMPYARMR